MQYHMPGGTSMGGTQEFSLVPGVFINGTETTEANTCQEEIPQHTAANKQAKQKKLAHIGGGFTKEEDKVICSAYLNVSKDPITGSSLRMIVTNLINCLT